MRLPVWCRRVILRTLSCCVNIILYVSISCCVLFSARGIEMVPQMISFPPVRRVVRSPCLRFAKDSSEAALRR